MARKWCVEAASCPSSWRQQTHSGGSARRNGGEHGPDFATRIGGKVAIKRSTSGVAPQRAARARLHTCCGRGFGCGAAWATIAFEKSALRARTPSPRTCTGWGRKFDFFYEFVPPGRIEGIIGGPRGVPEPPLLPEWGLPKTPSSAHVVMAMRWLPLRAQRSAVA